jgi:hypothetical protein
MARGTIRDEATPSSPALGDRGNSRSRDKAARGGPRLNLLNRPRARGRHELRLTPWLPIRETPMPFKSQAQRRKFAQLLVEGKIDPQTFEEWNRETGDAKLPERVRAKPKKKNAAVKKAAKKRPRKKASKR